MSIRHPLRWLLTPLTALTISACDQLSNYITIPTLDLTGDYIDTNVIFPNACGATQIGTISITIDTTTNPAQHDITMRIAIPQLDHTNTANWTVAGSRQQLGTTDPTLGTLSMKRENSNLAGTITPALECEEAQAGPAGSAEFVATPLR